jgi:hypothetical protein
VCGWIMAEIWGKAVVRDIGTVWLQMWGLQCRRGVRRRGRLGLSLSLCLGLQGCENRVCCLKLLHEMMDLGL